MRHSAIIRLSLSIVLPVAIAAACSDSGLSGVSPSDNGLVGTGNSGAGTGSGTNPQGSPTAGDTFSLVVHVIVRGPTGDTLHGTPVAGATATLTKTEWTFIHGNGGDTMSGHTVTVGSKTTDASGDAQFDHLSADLYHVTAIRPGSGAIDSAVAASVQLMNVSKAFVPIVLRPLP